MGFKLGMPMLYEFDSINEAVELCNELDLSFIELNMNYPSNCPENLDSSKIKIISERHDISFTLHLPEEIDLGTHHNSIREGYFKRCIEAIDFAHEAGISLVNMHIGNGIRVTLPDSKVYVYDRYKKEYINEALLNFSILANYATSKNINLCIENCGNFHLPFVNDLLSKVLEIDNIYLTWDTGHNAKNNFNDQHILDKYEHKIIHMHIHDFNGIDDHQELYTGKLDIDKLIDYSISKGNSVVVEVKNKESLKSSINKLQNIYVKK